MGAYDGKPQGHPQGQPQQQGMVPQQGQDDYYYPGDTYRGMVPSDTASQVRQAILNIPMPNKDTDYGEWIPMFMLAVDAAPRITGIDGKEYRKQVRRWKDIVARAHSQGRKRVLAASCQEMFFELRLLVSRCDTPALGMSGIGAMITQNQNVKQDIRYPQQPTTQGFWPWSKRQQQ